MRRMFEGEKKKFTTISIVLLIIASGMIGLIPADVKGDAVSATYSVTYTNARKYVIPNPGIVSSPLYVDANVVISRVDVSVAITHGRSGELNGWVVAPDGTAQQIIWASGDPSPNIYKTYTNLANFVGKNAKGTWLLRVQDTLGNAFSGTIDSWSITVYYSLTVNIIRPTKDATISGNYLVRVSASNVVSVNLFVDDVWISSMTYNGVEYRYTLDTTMFRDGKHVIKAVGNDNRGNSIADGHTVTIKNYNIYCVIVRPSSGSKVSDWVNVQALVPSNAAKGELYIDDSLVAVDYTVSNNRFSFWFNSRMYPDGNHRIKVISYDPWDNNAVSTIILNFENYQIFAKITSPPDGSTVSGHILVNVSVPMYASKGELYLDGLLVGTDNTISSNQFQFSLNTSKFNDGNHVITSIVYDYYGDRASDTISLKFKNYAITCRIIWPSENSVLSGNTTVWVKTEKFALKSELYVDGEMHTETSNLVAISSNYYFKHTLRTKYYPDGLHRILVKVYGQSNGIASDTISYIFNNYRMYVIITSPAPNSIVNGNIRINATIPPYTSKACLYVDNSLVSVIHPTTTTISFLLNTKAYSDGVHIIKVEAYNQYGNSAVATENLIFDNWKIYAKITSPSSGSTVSGLVNVTVSAPQYSTKCVLYIDDREYSTIVSSPTSGSYIFSLDTLSFKDGKHTITAKTYDPDDTSASDTIYVEIDNYKISARILYPPSGATLYGSRTITVSTQSYAERCEFMVDGLVFAVDRTLTHTGSYYLFSASINTRFWSDGAHTISAVVYDPDGSTASDFRRVFFENYNIYVVIRTPSDGSEVEGIISVSGEVPSYAKKAILYIDNNEYATTTSFTPISSTTSKFAFTLNTEKLTDGMHMITVKAYDLYGDSAVDSVHVEVNNYNLQIEIWYPWDDSEVSGTISIWVYEVDSVMAELYVDNVLVQIQTEDDVYHFNFGDFYRFSLDTTYLFEGRHVLTVKGYDPYKNHAVSTVGIIVNNYDIYVIITQPRNGQVVKNTVTVIASVPNYAVKGELYIDGELTATASTPVLGTYTFSFDSKFYKDGMHTISVRAYDPQLNTAASTITVEIDNWDVSVDITSPSDGATVSGDIKITITLQDAERCEVYIDDALHSSLNNPESTVSLSINTKMYKDGYHTISCRAYDPESSSATDSISIYIDNYDIYATMLITPSGDVVAGKIHVYIYTASYAVKGELYVDDKKVGEDKTLSYSSGLYYFDFYIDTTKYKDGIHLLFAYAYDPEGTSAGVEKMLEFDNWRLTVSMQSPDNGATVSDSIKVECTVQSYAKKGELLVDGIVTLQTTKISNGKYSFILDTASYSDGWHVLSIRAYDPDGNTALDSITIRFDNSPPTIKNIKVIYPSGQTAVRKNQEVVITAEVYDDVSGVSETWCNSTNIGGNYSRMYDDGLHNDSTLSDGIFGSNKIKVDTTMGKHFVFINAFDYAGNMKTATAKVLVDTHKPLITKSYVIYPSGQSAAKKSDKIRVVSRVIDTKMTVDVVLVIDTSGSMRGTAISDAKKAAKSFIGKLGPHDRAAIYSFDNPRGAGGTKPQLEISFTSNKNKLNSTIDSLSANDWTPLYDTIYAAIQYAKTSPNLPVVIALTDGNDIIGYDNQGNPKHSTHTLDDCKNASIPVYTIGLKPGSGYDPLNETVLKEIAYSSDGGTYYYAPSSSQLGEIYNDLARVVEHMDVGGIAKVYCDGKPLLSSSVIMMYDDGKHDDIMPNDGYYGSDYITVSISSTAKVRVNITAIDIAGNKDGDYATVLVDNTPPTISSGKVIYKRGQWWASDGDSVYTTCKVKDSGSVSGVSYVYLDASSVNANSKINMNDEGKGNDGSSGDGTYSSESFSPNTGGETGIYKMTVTAIDIAGNTGKGLITIYMDSFRPLNVSVVSPLNRQYVWDIVPIRVYASNKDTVKSMEIILNDERFKVEYNTATNYYEHLLDTNLYPDGKYTVYAECNDLAGHSKESDNKVLFYIDNTPPNLVVNYPKDGDYVEGEVLINTTGTYDMFLEKVCYKIDDGQWIDISEAWNTKNFTDGKHVVTVCAMDKSGKQTATSIEVIVDNTPPECRIVNPTDREYIKGELNIQIQANDCVKVSRVIVYVGNGKYPTNYDIHTNMYVLFIDTESLPDGEYKIKAHAWDDMGHAISSREIVVYIDNNVPSLEILSPMECYVEGIVKIEVNASDGYFTDELSVEFEIDGSEWNTLEYNKTTDTWIKEFDSTIYKDGKHILSIRAYDRIGNEIRDYVDIIIDNNKPICILREPKDGDYIEGIVEIIVISEDDVGVEKVEIEISGKKEIEDEMRYDSLEKIYKYTLRSNNLPDGDYKIQAICHDLSGKSSKSEKINVRIDNNEPSFFLKYPKEGDYVSGEISIDIEVQTYEGENITIKYSIDNSGWKDISEKLDTSLLKDGEHLLKLRIVDDAGHEVNKEVKFYVDNEYPMMLILSPFPGQHCTETVDVKVRAEDYVALKDIYFILDNGSPINLFYDFTTGIYYYPINLRGINDGNHVIVVVASDYAGHTINSSVMIFVDSQPPEMEIYSPYLDEDIKGLIEFEVKARDDTGIESIKMRIDGGEWQEMVKDTRTGLYSMTWNSKRTDDGRHYIEILGEDSLGHKKVISSEIYVRNREPSFIESWWWAILSVILVGIVLGVVIGYLLDKKKRYTGKIEDEPLPSLEKERPDKPPTEQLKKENYEEIEEEIEETDDIEDDEIEEIEMEEIPKEEIISEDIELTSFEEDVEFEDVEEVTFEDDIEEIEEVEMDYEEKKEEILPTTPKRKTAEDILESILTRDRESMKSKKAERKEIQHHIEVPHTAVKTVPKDVVMAKPTKKKDTISSILDDLLK